MVRDNHHNEISHSDYQFVDRHKVTGGPLPKPSDSQYDVNESCKVPAESKINVNYSISGYDSAIILIRSSISCLN